MKTKEKTGFINRWEQALIKTSLNSLFIMVPNNSAHIDALSSTFTAPSANASQSNKAMNVIGDGNPGAVQIRSLTASQIKTDPLHLSLTLTIHEGTFDFLGLWKLKGRLGRPIGITLPVFELAPQPGFTQQEGTQAMLQRASQ